MSVTRDGKEYAIGCVMGIKTHCWLDGMDEDTAMWYNPETNEIKSEEVYYGGIDGHNMNNCFAKVDFSEEMYRLYIHNNKQQAYDAFASSVVAHKNKVRVGSNVEVVKGRKVKQGTKLNVFWVGVKPTYFAKTHSWCDETFTLAGCKDECGNTVWIDADYLKVVDKIKSPNAKQRKEFVKNYFKLFIADKVVK